MLISIFTILCFVPYISVLYPEESRQILPIPIKGLVVGREPSCDLCLSDVFVSAQHCKIFIENEKFFIEDFDSTNGTAIDGAEIISRYAMPLETEQNIQIGITVMKIYR